MRGRRGWLGRVWTRGAALGVGVGVLMVCLAGLGSAADGRAVAAKAAATGVEGVSFGDVWCASRTSCIAVGGRLVGDDTEAAAATWNGISWSVQSVPVVASATQTWLSAVSCTSISSCIAVGTGGQRALVERWNGTRWSLQRTPVTPFGGNTPQLEGVSCPRRNMCMAVGTYVANGQVFLAERWNGRRWFIQFKLAAMAGGISAVSCPNPSFCVAAVGSDIMRWNGRRWSTTPLPTPKGFGVGVSAVTCPTRHRCTAVGQDGSGESLVAESWSGKRWSPRVIPTPSQYQFERTGEYPELRDISCPSRTSCIAVGNYATDDYGDLTNPLVARYNGRRWRIHAIRLPNQPLSASLIGVSCPSPTHCTAVGDDTDYSGPRPLLATWNGTSWATSIPEVKSRTRLMPSGQRHP